MVAGRSLGLDWFRDSRTQGRMGATPIADEFSEDDAKVLFVSRDEVVEALSPNGSDQTLAEAVRLRRADRSSDHANAKTFQRFVQPRRGDRIAIMENTSIRVRIGEELPNGS